MKRVYSFPTFFVLFVLLSGCLIGCSKSTDQASNQSPEQATEQAVGNSVNYSTAEPIEIPTLKTEKEFEDFVANNEIAVVKFGAEWCGPCCALSPELCKQAGYFQTENVKYAEIDVDALDGLATRMNVGSIPDVRVYYEGRPYSQIVGNDPESIANLVNSLCVNKPAAPASEQAAEQGAEEKAQDDLLPMLDTEESFRSFVKDNKFAVVKFGADWCPPCRMLIPELRKQAEYYKDVDVKFAEIDVDNEKVASLSEEFKIMAIPLTQIYKDGELQNSITGFQPDEISKEISKMCQKEPLLIKKDDEIDDDKPLEDELWPEDAESNESEKSGE